MKKIQGIPLGIWIFVFLIIVLDVFYFYKFFTEQVLDVMLTLNVFSLVMWIDLFLTGVSLFVIPYGFLRGKNWSRYFALIFLVWSAFWSILFIGMLEEVLLHYLLFVMYVILMVYLLMSSVKIYFVDPSKGIEPFFGKPGVYRYGSYILHKKEIKTRSGGTRTYYFFSREISDKGEPCSKPDGYMVSINRKTGVPYLKKKN